jgi:hypothetical protein
MDKIILAFFRWRKLTLWLRILPHIAPARPDSLHFFKQFLFFEWRILDFKNNVFAGRDDQPARVCQDRFDVYAPTKFHQSSVPSQKLQSCADKPGIPDTNCATIPETFSCRPARMQGSGAPCNSELGRWRSGRGA